MDKQSYDVRASIMVRYTVLQSKKNGHLQRLQKEYEQMQCDQLGMPFNKLSVNENHETYQSNHGDGLMHRFDEEICPLAKRRRIQNVKQRLRAALRLHWNGPDEIDEPE